MARGSDVTHAERPPAETRRSRAPLALVLVIGAALAGCGDDGPSARTTYAPDGVDAFTVAVSHILIKVEGKRTEGAARELAFQTHAKLVEGAEFAAVARRVSEDEARTQGGFLGFVPAHAHTRFSGACQALPPGALSMPIRTAIGYQIIQRHTFAEAAAREAEIAIPVYGFYLPFEHHPGADGRPANRSKEETRQLARQVVAALRSGATTLSEAQRQHLGMNPRGPSDPFLFRIGHQPSFAELRKAVEGIAPGEYADPVAGPKGMAILQRGTNLRSLVRHILVQHRESEERSLRIIRSREEAAARATEALKALASDGSNWNRILARFTDDDLQVRPGGSLGAVTNGDLPRHLESALVETPPGTVHGRVLESPRGFHVLWRVR